MIRRVSPTEIRALAALYNFLEPGELINGVPDHAVFKKFWQVARPDTFAPPPDVLALRLVKAR